MVLRDPEYEYTIGVRANQHMDWKKSLRSLIIPWHVEWLPIYLYLAFAMYFLVQTFLIMAKHPSYKFKY